MSAHLRRSSIVLVQSLLVVLSLVLAWLLRFEFTCPLPNLLLFAIPVLLLFRTASMARFGLLHGYWRYSGSKDLEDIVGSVALGSCGFIVAIRYILDIKAFPLSVYILEALITTALLGGARFIFRQTLQRRETSQSRAEQDVRVLVVGAGSAAYELVRQLPRHGYSPIACVDDDPAKQGARIHGVPVEGAIARIPSLVRKHEIDEILIAIASLSGTRMREITEICQSTGVKFRTIPAFGDLVGGRVTVSQLREVVLEDLLSREPVKLELEQIRNSLAGKRVLVTGAAGSIGSELCLQILNFSPSLLLCLDQDESGIFALGQQLDSLPGSERIRYVVANMTDKQRLREVIDGDIDVVFHAAAYKHVPLMEANVAEAIRNNITGLITTLDEAERAGGSTFVLISSDKAVNPSSVMGCTKRVGELIIAARPRSAMRCVSVRFGNVLGSQGSVVPTFKEQIRTLGHVTVTHPDITRFFMTIPEASSLVLQASTIGSHGDVMVLDMGQPIRIADLARTLIKMLGKKEDEVEIVYTGLRQGEKLYEELFYPSEQPLHTSCDKVTRVRGDRVDGTILHNHLRELSELLYNSNPDLLRAKLRQIVPEYDYAQHQTVPQSHPSTEQPARTGYVNSLTLLDVTE